VIECILTMIQSDFLPGGTAHQGMDARKGLFVMQLTRFMLYALPCVVS
jgi:hypothetical protein